MATALTSHDAVQINERVLSGLADGDAVTIEFDSDIASVKTAKNGNMLFSENKTGLQATVTIRVLLACDDDKWLNSQLALQRQDFSAMTLLTGCFAKRTGDGAGNISTKIYQCSGGVMLHMPSAKTNAEGDTEQSVSVYKIKFGSCDISIQ